MHDTRISGDTENPPDRGSKNDEPARYGASVGRELGAITPIADLRRALDAAILERAWTAVEVIGARLREAERADVVELETERRRRRPR